MQRMFWMLALALLTLIALSPLVLAGPKPVTRGAGTGGIRGSFTPSTIKKSTFTTHSQTHTTFHGHAGVHTTIPHKPVLTGQHNTFLGGIKKPVVTTNHATGFSAGIKKPLVTTAIKKPVVTTGIKKSFTTTITTVKVPGHGAGHIKVGLYATQFGKKFHGGVFYPGFHHRHWAGKFWSPHWKTWCWYCPCTKGWYYWHATHAGYYPVSYLPSAPPVPMVPGLAPQVPGANTIPEVSEEQVPELPPAE